MNVWQWGRSGSGFYWMAGMLMCLHGFLVTQAVRRQSVVWDEIVTPAVGLSQWKTGMIGINQEHPFLSKLIASAPLLLTKASVPLTSESWQKGDYFRVGEEFTFHGEVSPRRVTRLTRLPMIILSLGAGGILFFWIHSLWGPRGAFMGLLGYVSTPVLTARGSLALLEMPQYFFLILTLALWTSWVRSGRRSRLWWSSLTGGMALTCKMSSVIFLLPLAMVGLARIVGNLSMFQPWKNRVFPSSRYEGPGVQSSCLIDVLLWGVGLWVTVLALYLPWQGGVSALVTALKFPFRFSETHSSYYFAGTVLDSPPSVLTWVAAMIKAPPFVLFLAAMGFYAWVVSKKHREVLYSLLAIVVFVGLSAGLMKSALSTVQVSSIYIVFAVLISGVTARKWGKIGLTGVVICGLLAMADMVHSSANPLAYFNFSVGGSHRGYRWLADSDQDWGQWLPSLAGYWNKQGRPGLLLCYSGPSDPAAYGLEFQDLLSAALFVHHPREVSIPLGTPRIYLAVGTKMIQSEPRLFAWLQNNVAPIAQPDPCFFIYDISHDPEAFRWAAALYDFIRRPLRAEWARAQARQVELRMDEQMKRSLGIDAPTHPVRRREEL